MDNFFKNKNVLVTGGTGLVGSHLVERLAALGAKVFALDIVLLPKSYFDAQNLKEKNTVIWTDLRDFEKVKQAIAQNNISHIFHLGAQALVPKALEDPLETFSSNVMGTVNVLEAARLLPQVKAVVVASSDKSYGKDCVNVTEEQKVFGDHPYDASKASADIIARTYYATYKLPVTVARFGNIFGGGDLYFNRLVPGIMEAILKNQGLKIRSNGQFRRDYLYVKDVVEGYIKMAEHIEKSQGQAFNFSTNWNYSVVELVEKISQIIGKKCKYEILDNQINEIPEQSLNSEKAKAVLGWQLQTNLDQAIKETFYWYKSYFEGEKVA